MRRFSIAGACCGGRALRPTPMRCVVVIAACALPMKVAAQHSAHAGAPQAATADRHPMDAAAFVHATRAGVLRFRDRREAVAAGYRRLGPSFPGMGEHWIHPGLIVRGAIVPGEPAVLCYADVDGTPRLVGAAYAFALPRDAPLPPLPAGADHWHIHQDAVDEETLLLVHPAVQASSGMRLVMTHVWTELDNPAGVFAQNNWMLPFVQAGLTPSAPPTRDAAQALSLLTAGPAYYERLFGALAAPDAAEHAVITAALREARDSVVAWAAGLPARSSVAAGGSRADDAEGMTPSREPAGSRESGADARVPLVAGGHREAGAEELARLAEAWASLWSTLDARLPPATFAKLRAWEGAAGQVAEGRAGAHDTHRR